MRMWFKLLAAVLLGCALTSAVVVMASRVQDDARFVTWPVVAFTALAAIVVMIGVWTGARQLIGLTWGLLPAAVISYFLPAAPLALVAVVLGVMAGLAVVARGVACGVAAGTGALMIVFTVLQGPAVQCGKSSVSGNSGPWWVDQPSQSTGSGTATAGGALAAGTVEVGDQRFRYVCEDGRLASFQRVAT